MILDGEGKLPITVELAYNGAWNDITSDVNASDDIEIVYGRGGDDGSTDPAKCTLLINNTDGRYSPLNPRSPLYSLIGKNTGLRIRLPSVRSGLSLPGIQGSYAYTPDVAALDVTGDIDIRLEVTPPTWRPSTYTMLATKYLGGGNISWMLLLLANGTMEFSWSADGTTRLVRTSTAAIPATSGRLAVRVVLDVNDGAGGHAVSFYTASSISDPWTQLGTTVTTAGTTSVFAGTAQLAVGAIHNGQLPFTNVVPFSGLVHSFELRNGISGTPVAQVAFTAEDPDTFSFTDDAGRAWTVSGPDARIVDPGIRFRGGVSSWPTRWDSPDYAWVPIEANGVLRRIRQGEEPLRSAMARGLTGSNRPTPRAYWPCEEDKDATVIGSGLSGGPTMAISGTVQFAAYTGFDCSAAIPTIGTGTLFGNVTDYTPSTSYLRVMSLLHLPSTGVPAATRLMRVTTTGTAQDWSIEVDTAGSLRLIAKDAPDGNVLLTTAWVTFGLNDVDNAFGLYLIQNGANVDWQIFSYRIGDTAPDVSSGTLTGRTFGVARSVTMGGVADLGSTAVGHVAVFDTDAFWDMLTFINAWRGETANGRVSRLCGEEGVGLVVLGGAQATELIGPQKPGTFQDLAQAAADADLGILGESLSSEALLYRTRASLYNQTSQLALDYLAGQVAAPFEPTDDDQAIRNDITVTRDGGSLVRAVQATGEMSILEPPLGVDRYNTQVTLNLAHDGLLRNQANWRLHLGTVNELRYPAVHLDLYSSPELAEDAMGMRLGDRISITNPPAWLPPESIGQLVNGWTERLNTFAWDIVYNCTPASPWDVWAVGADDSERADTVLSTTTSTFAAGTDTSLYVRTMAGPSWTTDPTQFPFDVTAAGVQLRVTSIGSSATDAFGRTVSNGWGSTDTGQAWTTAGGSASDYSVGSGVGKMTLSSVNVLRWSVLELSSTDFDLTATVSTDKLAAGAPQYAVLHGRLTDVSNNYFCWLELTTSAAINLVIGKLVAGVGTALTTNTATGLTHVANTQYRFRFAGQGQNLRAKAWLASSTEPDRWQQTVMDSTFTTGTKAALMSYLSSGNTNTLPVTTSWDGLDVRNPQKFTVQQAPVNGVEKTFGAQAQVHVASPLVVSL